jgi:DNA-binding HxlR family transcriptional regulator
MRSYSQYCGLARALDVVGDRWTLLIVRELLILGPARYTDLQRGLPGIATNLLVTRLREMEESGLVAREDAPPPSTAKLFRLTPRGAALEAAMVALGAWAGPLMGEPREDDEVRSHWMAMPVRHFLIDRSPSRRPVTIECRMGDESMLVETVDGGVRARPGTAEKPDAVLAGPIHLVMGVLTGRIALAAARTRGLHFEGSPAVLRRIQPRMR